MKRFLLNLAALIVLAPSVLICTENLSTIILGTLWLTAVVYVMSTTKIGRRLMRNFYRQTLEIEELMKPSSKD